MLKEFIDNNKVTSTSRTVGEEVLIEAQKSVGVSFGNELKEYLLKYGYLAFGFVELYGINSNQNLESDLVKQTNYIHNYFPQTSKLIAIENQGEGDYYMIDSNDNVYEFDSELGELTNLSIKLFEYILKRFETTKKYMNK